MGWAGNSLEEAMLCLSKNVRLDWRKGSQQSMCGRYSITTPVEAMRRMFKFEGLPNLGANYNVAPTNAVPVVRLKDNHRDIAMMRWGLVPSWAKEIRPKPLINARAETVAEKPAFRGPYRHHRCLVPADGYYEWRKEPDGGKQPYYILRADGQMFAMAGIWTDWMAPDGSELDTMAIITTRANDHLRPLHDRMPVMIEEKDFELWLETSGGKDLDVDALLKPAPNDQFVAHPVSRRVNRVGVDDPELIEPISLREDSSEQPEDKDPKDGQLDLL
ncbi:MAG: SOS response-associated peptidase [Alphaproteobacteria bacterium]|nr:MAG: SOS response-associated peptidase [Alphaproteobacteria bacterium]